MAFLLFISCSTQKVAKVDIINHNAYPITVKIKANNIQQSYTQIKPNERRTSTLDWTGLSQEEGEFIFFIKNENQGTLDSFSHGFIRHGELYNYIYLDANGSELKVDISN